MIIQLEVKVINISFMICQFISIIFEFYYCFNFSDFVIISTDYFIHHCLYTLWSCRISDEPLASFLLLFFCSNLFNWLWVFHYIAALFILFLLRSFSTRITTSIKVIYIHTTIRQKILFIVFVFDCNVRCWIRIDTPYRPRNFHFVIYIYRIVL